jgi:acyl carrier protein
MKTPVTSTGLNWNGSSDAVQASVADRLQLAADQGDAGVALRNANILEEEIRRFLADIFFLGDDPSTLPGSKSLIEAGILDSTGILELIGFLEEQFGIRIEDDELIPENLDSVENIVRFVTRKRGS